MTLFIGTEDDDIANVALGILSPGFTGGTLVELNDGLGDTFVCGGGDDFVFAPNANDRIEGGEGHDMLNGGEGNDIIYGNTQVAPDGSLIGDEIVGNLGGDGLYGSNGNDVIDGGAGDDTLRGGGGADGLFGGFGDDILEFSTNQVLPGETIDGALGIDSINGTGNSLGNALLGNNGANLLNGMAGADVMSGNDGNDTYIVDNVVREGAGKGTDRVLTGISHTLANDVEHLTLTGAANAAATGNALANTIVGNAGNNVIAGKGGNDLLTTGGGADIVLFDTALSQSGNFDTVADFNVAADTFRLDRSVFAALGLGTLNADAFITGAAAADAEDRIIYNTANDNLYYDRDGTGSAAAVAFAHVNGNPVLTNADFVVVA